MNVLGTLLLLILAGFALTALAPVLAVGLGLAATLGCLFIWLLPILLILGSNRTCASEKLAWILAIIFLSWFAWIFYLLLAPVKDCSDHRAYRYD